MKRIVQALAAVWHKSMMYRTMLVAPPITLILLVGYVTVGSQANVQYYTAKVEKGDISQVVQSTGTINPYNTVPVGSVVSGNVVAINVDYNSPVKKGDILAQIDPVPFQDSLAQANANTGECSGKRSKFGGAGRYETEPTCGTMQANVAKAHAFTIDMGTEHTHEAPGGARYWLRSRTTMPWQPTTKPSRRRRPP